ncbi:hypothetical protein OE88DRAFT_1660904 [Heliocybe sulcata]|uniref:Uncharacterized protein n=1 Tax=Heliocybe sulcata TaxID=5364 RepID=A0A5C3MZL0_9AGAM|nr:hypothetical protein OE88DRAFT_1660904 [Heliocybe sulcata]
MTSSNRRPPALMNTNGRATRLIDGEKADAAYISGGVFGATAGIDRLLKLSDKCQMKGTW